jgi:hypothetical protein
MKDDERQRLEAESRPDPELTGAIATVCADMSIATISEIAAAVRDRFPGVWQRNADVLSRLGVQSCMVEMFHCLETAGFVTLGPGDAITAILRRPTMREFRGIATTAGALPPTKWATFYETIFGKPAPGEHYGLRLVSIEGERPLLPKIRSPHSKPRPRT